MYSILGTLVTPAGVIENGYLRIDDGGDIAEVSHNRPAKASDDIDAGGYLVLPGFIDMHVHGGGGADFMHGTPESVRTALRTHARFGTTGLLATTLTSSREAIDEAIVAVKTVAGEGREQDEARILGIHLEGPYICRDRRGAQPEAHIRPPDVDELAHWLEIAGGLVRQITIAPELSGAREVIEYAAVHGVVASIGHTDAGSTEVLNAVGWGAKQATHLFNAMRGMGHREPGAAGAALACPEILAELICDGIHVDPLVVKVVVAAKGRHGIVLITDAIEGAAMPDGEYELGGFTIRVSGGRAVLADGTLAGSILTMNRAFHNVRQFAGIAPDVAADLASTNAARQLGLSDRYGALAPGHSADITIVDPSTGDVFATIIGGRIAYRR